jgi:GNAT superfamily N-acetyltransferase
MSQNNNSEYLYQTTHTEHNSLFGTSHQYRTDCIDKDNNNVGYLNMVCNSEKSRCNVNMVYTNPDYRGKGIGSRLYEEALQTLHHTLPHSTQITACATTDGGSLVQKYIGTIDNKGCAYTMMEEAMKNVQQYRKS